ncbi:hypothetical protein BAE44_0012612, partial [Dichanthelium oligosanthes]
RWIASRSPAPLPIRAHATAGADGDLLVFDILWSSTGSPSSTIGLGLLAALLEDEGEKKKRATGGGAGPVRSAASGMTRSAPVRIPSKPARRGGGLRPARGLEDAGEAMVPPCRHTVHSSRLGRGTERGASVAEAMLRRW